MLCIGGFGIRLQFIFSSAWRDYRHLRAKWNPASDCRGRCWREDFEHEVEFVIGEQAFATKVGFMPSMSTQAGEGIVGQTGFFDRFSFVKFNKGKHLIELGQFKMPEDGL